MALAHADPADARREYLNRNPLARHVEPAMEVRIVRDQLLHALVRAVDVLGITAQRDPAERANAAAEQRTDVSWNEPWEIERVGDAFVIGFLADVVAVIEGRDPHG